MVNFIETFLLGVSLTLPLGPVTLEILRRGIKLGYLHSLKTAFGAFSAEITYFLIVYMGMSKFSEHFIVKYILGVLGIGFLLYLGYENLKDYFSKSVSFSKKMVYNNSYVAGYLVTFLNPLNFFMWAGIIGAFFLNSTGFFVSSGVLYGIFISLIAITGLSQLGRKLMRKDKMKYVSLIAGLFLIFYGLKLLYNMF